jgi:leucyl-tRNA synthetase
LDRSLRRGRDDFKVSNGLQEFDMEIFTTRADTVFGVTFMVLAPESDWVDKLTTPQQRKAVEDYVNYCKKRQREKE